MMPRRSPISQWGRGSKSNVGGVPSVRTMTLSSSPAPTGVSAWGMLGSSSRRAFSSSSISLTARLQGVEPVGEVARLVDEALALGGVAGGADALADGVALGPQRLRLGEEVAALAVEAEDPVQGGLFRLAVAQGLADGVGVVADELQT